MTRDDNELVKRVYRVQQANPSPGDFLQVVAKYFEIIGEAMDKYFMWNDKTRLQEAY